MNCEYMEHEPINTSDNCDCACAIEQRKVTQQTTSMCWFLSLVHILLWSDYFKPVRESRKKVTLDQAVTLVTSLSNKPCTLDPFNTALVTYYCQFSKPYYYDNSSKTSILREYFSPTKLHFGPADPEKGNVALNYLMPMLVHMGYDIKNLKHVISSLHEVYRLYKQS